MLDGKVFVVYTTNDELIGMIAIAEKFTRNSNLVSFIKKHKCTSLNVCSTWKEAKELETKWNENFRINGNQKEKNPIIVMCYNQTKNWDSREKAIEFYKDAINNSEGSERDRYVNILMDLEDGKMICRDLEF